VKIESLVEGIKRALVIPHRSAKLVRASVCLLIMVLQLLLLLLGGLMKFIITQKRVRVRLDKGTKELRLSLNNRSVKESRDQSSIDFLSILVMVIVSTVRWVQSGVLSGLV
jgi:hypothetical protein